MNYQLKNLPKIQKLYRNSYDVYFVINDISVVYVWLVCFW